MWKFLFPIYSGFGITNRLFFFMAFPNGVFKFHNVSWKHCTFTSVCLSVMEVLMSLCVWIYFCDYACVGIKHNAKNKIIFILYNIF